MTALRERYNLYRTPEIESKFAKWNDEQEELLKIKVRMPFTVEWPEAKMLKLEEKAKKDKDGKDFTDKWRPYKMLSATGVEVPYKIQSPSVIAKRGLCVIDTGSGKILSIPCTYDIRNPEHAQFLDQYEAKIATPAYYEVLRNPGSYGIDSIEPVAEFTQDVISSQEFFKALVTVQGKFSKFTRFPKKAAKLFDTKSPTRTIFYTPTNYLPKKENETGSQMRCIVSFGQNVREYSMNEIKKFCEGYTIVDGKEVKGTPKGFECAPELQFIKLHIGSQLSNKTACPAVFITRFQETPHTDTQEEKIKFMSESGMQEDSYSADSGILNVLETLKSVQLNQSGKPPSGGSGFSAMGPGIAESNITAPLGSQNQGDSFISMAQQSSTQETTPDISSPGGSLHQIQQPPQQTQQPQIQDQLPYTNAQANAYVQMANPLPQPLQQQSMQIPYMNGLPNGPPSIPGLGMPMMQDIPGIPGLGNSYLSNSI